MKEGISKAGVEAEVHGWPPLTILGFQHENETTAAAMKALYVRRQLSRGFLSSACHYIMTSHTREDVHAYLSAAEESFKEVKLAMDNSTLMDEIEHQPSLALFKRLA